MAITILLPAILAHSLALGGRSLLVQQKEERAAHDESPRLSLGKRHSFSSTSRKNIVSSLTLPQEGSAYDSHQPGNFPRHFSSTAFAANHALLDDNDDDDDDFETRNRAVISKILTRSQSSQLLTIDERALAERGLANLMRVVGEPFIQCVLGDDGEPLSSSILDYHPSWLERVLWWADIHRGSDLFFTGMGGFRMDQAYDRALECARSKALLGLTADGMDQIRRDKSSTLIVRYMTGEEGGEACEGGVEVDSAYDARFVQQWSDLNLSPYLFQNAVRERTVRLNIDRLEFGQKLLEATIPHPLDVQVAGYFCVKGHETGGCPQVQTSADDRKAIRKILESSDSHPAKIHLIQNYHGWRNRRDVTHWADVLSRSTVWPNGWRDMTPDQLLREFEERRLRRRYQYLDELQDAGRMRVLRSSWDIRHVARVLDNCAFEEYAVRAEAEWSILVALMDQDNGKLESDDKILALGAVDIDTVGVDHGWEERECYDNTETSSEMNQLFDEYLESHIRPWWKEKYAPNKSSK